MALSISQSVSLCSLRHVKLPFTPQLQSMPLSKARADLLKFPSIRCSSSFNNKSRVTLKTCKNCKTQYDPALNHPLACRFHTAHFGDASHNVGSSHGSLNISEAEVNEEIYHEKVKTLQLGQGYAIRRCTSHVTIVLKGETKRKFESVYKGGTMDTPDSGQVFQYWHCCGSEDPFGPGCTAAPHSSYDD